MLFASWSSSFASRSLLSGTKRHRRSSRGRYECQIIAAELLEPRALLSVMAMDDSGNMTNHNQPITIDVLSNDCASGGMDSNGNMIMPGPLSATAISSPSHGSVTVESNGNLTYTPANGYVGNDSFTYQATYGTDTSSNALVSIAVMDMAPSDSDDNYSVMHNHVLTINAAQGVLSNASDSDFDPLTAILVGNPSHGSVSLSSNGSFSYTPTNNYAGSDTFTYKANDSHVDGNTITVTISVDDFAPTESDPTYDALSARALVVDAAHGLLATATDPDGDLNLTVSSYTQPLSGAALSVAPDGSFTYTANGYEGSDSFQFALSDGMEDSVIISATINSTGIKLTFDGSNAFVPSNEAWVGEKISMTAALGGGLQIQSPLWSIGGFPKSGMDELSDGNSRFVYQPVSWIARQRPSISFYWIRDDVYFVSITIDVFDPQLNITYTSVTSGNATFDVKEPNITLSALGPTLVGPQSVNGKTEMRFGDVDDPYDGIHLSFSPDDDAAPGTYRFTQVVDNATIRYKRDDGIWFRIQATSVVDKGADYVNATNQPNDIPPNQAIDVPRVELGPSNKREFEYNVSYSMYVMWKSNKLDSLWVGIEVVHWNWTWSATSSNGTNWVITNNTRTTNFTSQDAGEVIWSGGTIQNASANPVQE